MSEDASPADKVGRCDTKGCHRDAVVTHTYGDPESMTVSYNADLCLPCRRILAYASRIPWGDTSEDWADDESLRQYLDEEQNVTAARENWGDSDGQ